MCCYGLKLVRNKYGQIIQYTVYDYFGNPHVIFDLTKESFDSALDRLNKLYNTPR